jgi:plasmid stabilization system protein ParE
MAEYIISEKTLEDLNNIWVYTAENWPAPLSVLSKHKFIV